MKSKLKLILSILFVSAVLGFGSYTLHAGGPFPPCPPCFETPSK